MTTPKSPVVAALELVAGFVPSLPALEGSQQRKSFLAIWRSLADPFVFEPWYFVARTSSTHSVPELVAMHDRLTGRR